MKLTLCKFRERMKRVEQLEKDLEDSCNQLKQVKEERHQLQRRLKQCDSAPLKERAEKEAHLKEIEDLRAEVVSLSGEKGCAEIHIPI